LGLAVEEGNPMINGIVNFTSFVIFGFFPLLPYIVYKIHSFNESSLIISSTIIGAFFFLTLGFMKAWLVGGRKIFSAGLTLLLGGGAVAAGYVVGLGLKVPKAANAA
jgi:VIT1/CCC1 family predicted Fe2+/Mn2+ transporter